MNISLDSTEISEKKLEKLSAFLQLNHLEYYYNSIGIDFDLPVEFVDEFYWIIIKSDDEL